LQPYTHLLDVAFEVLGDEVLRQEAQRGVTAAKAQLTCSSSSSRSCECEVYRLQHLSCMCMTTAVLMTPARYNQLHFDTNVACATCQLAHPLVCNM
jgi:hypothetical protein